MFLTIVVPHYNESWNICKPFFDILENQKGIDFEDFKIIVVHDGTEASNTFDWRYIYGSKLNIQQVTVSPHKGVSACRNMGIDLADSEWICFCDCDDCYTSIFSLMMIFHVLKSKEADNFDLMWGSFYMHNENYLSKSTDYNPVFIHNRYYRLSFLREHNIRFCEDLYMSEDSAFNTLIRLEIGERRTGTINSNEPLYAWCRRKNSITMDKSKWLYNTEGQFKRNLYVLNEYRKRKHPSSNSMVARTLTDVYSMLSKSDCQGDPSNLIKMAAKFYKDNKNEYATVDQSKISKMIEASDKDCGISEEDKKNRPSFDEWLNKLSE
jgi:glycosyltransferase involved in cell wall biosynthesis